MEAFDELVAGLPPVGLDDLRRTAPLLVRRDRKYLVPLGHLPLLVAGLPVRSEALDIAGVRSFTYESLYFDTPSRVSYLDAARRRPRRWKVRRRTYHDTGERFVEVKVRDRRGMTIKQRSPSAPADDRREPNRLSPDDRSFVAGAEHLAGFDLAVAELEPVLITRYVRTTMLLPEIGARMSIDRVVRFVDAHRTQGSELADVAVVEIKSAGRVTAADRQLRHLGHRPAPISKYGTGLASLHPELPSNRWHRTLGRSGLGPAARDDDRPSGRAAAD